MLTQTYCLINLIFSIISLIAFIVIGVKLDITLINKYFFQALSLSKNDYAYHGWILLIFFIIFVHGIIVYLTKSKYSLIIYLISTSISIYISFWKFNILLVILSFLNIIYGFFIFNWITSIYDLQGNSFLEMHFPSLHKVYCRLLLSLKYYKIHYFKQDIIHLYKKTFSKPMKKEFDVVFVMTEWCRGWILEKICKKIAEQLDCSFTYCYDLDNIPTAKNYFFAHYEFLVSALKNCDHIRSSGLYTWYTHPKDIFVSENEMIYAFNRADKVICACSLFCDSLIEKGVKQDRITYVLGGVDKKDFSYHERSSDGLIGFCMAYYERKNPDLMFKIIKGMSDKKFILLGPIKKDKIGWENYTKYEELNSLPNLEIIDTHYLNYPEYYKKMSVFVSPALLEGGPIPLLEAMMSNVVPVSSKTGFAPDIIKHGENGYIFDLDSNSNEVIKFIKNALVLQCNIRKTVEELTWENFGLNIRDIFNKK